MEFTGESEKTNYTFKIVRKNGKTGATLPSLPLNHLKPAAIVEINEDGYQKKIQAGIPGK